MALKGDRFIEYTDVTFFMNEVAERGGCAVYSTVGSGAALDQAAALVTYSASQSGTTPAGILLDNMVNLDLTRQHLNHLNQELQKGMKVPLLKRGWVVTNMLIGGITTTAGTTAYLSYSGLMTNTDTGGGYPTVGRFESKKDEDGYAKISVNLQ